LPWEYLKEGESMYDFVCGFQRMSKINQWFTKKQQEKIVNQNTDQRLKKLFVKRRLIGRSGRQCFYRPEDIISEIIILE
jgi:hypothetical protein